MKKIEKFKSFQEMKASSKSIDSTNFALVMERHRKMKDFIDFLGSEHIVNTPTKVKKSVSQS